MSATDNGQPTAITGAAGAYSVTAELSQRGWIASPTWGNAPRTDVLAQRADGSRMAAIQVKTRRTGTFAVGNPAPSPEQANEWFVMVSLNGPGQRPDFYVIPRDHLVALAYVGDEEYKKRRGRTKSVRTAVNPIDLEAYSERWDLLEDDADAPPWMIPVWVWELAEDFPPLVDLGVRDAAAPSSAEPLLSKEVPRRVGRNPRPERCGFDE